MSEDSYNALIEQPPEEFDAHQQPCILRSPSGMLHRPVHQDRVSSGRHEAWPKRRITSWNTRRSPLKSLKQTLRSYHKKTFHNLSRRDQTRFCSQPRGPLFTKLRKAGKFIDSSQPQAPKGTLRPTKSVMNSLRQSVRSAFSTKSEEATAEGFRLPSNSNRSNSLRSRLAATVIRRSQYQIYRGAPPLFRLPSKPSSIEIRKSPEPVSLPGNSSDWSAPTPLPPDKTIKPSMHKIGNTSSPGLDETAALQHSLRLTITGEDDVEYKEKASILSSCMPLQDLVDKVILEEFETEVEKFREYLLRKVLERKRQEVCSVSL